MITGHNVVVMGAGHNNRKLWVLACMDERLPIDEALGIHVDTPAGHGDAHCFRNAGGIVTDDAIRSAMLTCNFFGTKKLLLCDSILNAACYLQMRLIWKRFSR